MLPRTPQATTAIKRLSKHERTIAKQNGLPAFPFTRGRKAKRSGISLVLHREYAAFFSTAALSFCINGKRFIDSNLFAEATAIPKTPITVSTKTSAEKREIASSASLQFFALPDFGPRKPFGHRF